MSLELLCADIATACLAIDANGQPFRAFKPGVGPYGEPQLVKLIAAHLNQAPAYSGRAASKRTPDLLIRDQWALEFKVARPFGDDGKVAENWSVNLLHPYPGNVSLYGDCLKLAEWPGPERRAAIVVAFEHDPAIISLDPLFVAFEILAERLLPLPLSPRAEVRRVGLKHPVHQVLRVAAWEVPPSAGITTA